MRKRFILGILAFAMLCSGQLLAKFGKEGLTLDFSAGYRQDYFKWNVSGPDGVPHILSELKWDKLNSYGFLVEGRYVNCYHIYFRGYADYARIYCGRNHDTDFAGHHRHHDSSSSGSSSSGSSSSGHHHHRAFEILRTEGKANKGELFDFSGGIGYQFTFLVDRVSVSPVGGYSEHEQHLNISDVEIEFNAITDFVGPVPGVHSRYNARWQGPWVGVDYTLQMTCNMWAYGTAEFHWARFQAKGHWNLRSDFVDDFRQKGHGHGRVFTFGINYDMGSIWHRTLSFGLIGTYQTWRLNNGTDRVFFREGHVKSKLNTIHWWSWSVMAQVNYRY